LHRIFETCHNIPTSTEYYELNLNLSSSVKNLLFNSFWFKTNPKQCCNILDHVMTYSLCSGHENVIDHSLIFSFTNDFVNKSIIKWFLLQSWFLLVCWANKNTFECNYMFIVVFTLFMLLVKQPWNSLLLHYFFQFCWCFHTTCLLYCIALRRFRASTLVGSLPFKT